MNNADCHLRSHMRDHPDWTWSSKDGETTFVGSAGSGTEPSQKAKYRIVLEEWVDDFPTPRYTVYPVRSAMCSAWPTRADSRTGPTCAERAFRF